MYTKPYIPPTLVVDSVIFQLSGSELQVLLVKRSADPFKGSWALPGGYCAAGETTKEAMSRIISAKAGLDTSDLDIIEQLYTFDTIARDPRGHAVSVSYMGVGRDIEPGTNANAQEPEFFSVADLPELAYDHKNIIDYAVVRLKSKLSHTNASFALLPDLVTLSEVQTAYEAVLGHSLDKRNFRKKIQSLDILKATDQKRRDGAHRPALLYKFASRKLQEQNQHFE